MKVLVTGATGFVGSAFVRRGLAEGWAVRAVVRRERSDLPRDVEVITAGSLETEANWASVVRGVDVVVHAAARVHVMRETAHDPLQAFRRVNVEGTAALARAAAEAGARRFVFVSSVKVNGERTDAGRPFRPSDAAAPTDPYGQSKAEAEETLRTISVSTGMAVTIVRPVLVYGPGVKGNFRTLMGLLSRGIPLPFGRVHNARSLLGLDNLVDFLVICVQHPRASSQTYLVSDGEDLSTPDLLRRTARALGTRARLLSVPVPMLRSACWVLRRGELCTRLMGSLQVDPSAALELGWKPPIPVDLGLRRAAEHYLRSRNGR